MNYFAVSQAKLWNKYYKARRWLRITKSKHGTVASWLILLLAVIVSGFFVSVVQSPLESYFSVQERFSGLKTLFLTLGGALIGSTAIAFSLIMFAMQVNVERMPHGLFRKFSSDLKLLGAFTSTFLLSIAITSLSLIPDQSWAVATILVAAWGLVLIVIFFLVAYRRALDLISPTKQLSFLVAGTKNNFDIWAKSARRASPLLKSNNSENDNSQDHRSDHDMERTTYFQINPGWTAQAEQGVAHCISFARRYAEQGDHEVSVAALNAILVINAQYIIAKGKTFFSNNYLFDNPLAGDAFINNTLEHLRQNVQVGISRGDEPQIEQSFRTLAALCEIYLGIDYASEGANKSHAHLAAGYLSNAVESVVPHDMADVLMEGVRLLGNSAQLILSHREPGHIAMMSEKIALIACTGVVNKNYRPVTQTAVMQLAKLTFELIRSQSHDVKFAIEEVRADVKFIAEMYLKIPDTALSRIHSTSLAPYYSGTSNDSLTTWLTGLTNAISGAEENDEAAQRVIHHIKQWADDLPQTEKDLFLLAVEYRSNFTFDIVHWIAHITKLLLAVSNADACDERNRDALRKSALWLISVLSWVPDEQGAVTFIENYQMTEVLFEAAMDARQRDCDVVAIGIRDLLFSWAFKAGKYQTGWGVLERACYGLACINIMFGLNDAALLISFEERVGREATASLNTRFRAAQKIREEAEAFHHRTYALRAIESAMAQVDQERLRTLLIGIAERLTPEIHDIQTEG